ncbi:MAG: hypothetical protein JWO81_404 [Alphaproteobacteria bacterium]|nr:hypothetical protein [Alphaproteobacteria bacterium]
MRKLLFAAVLLAVPIGVHAQHVGHQGHDMAGMDAGNATMPKESGQAAFGAITEVVALLEADPRTDWSKVDVDALRAHLVDMDNVVLHARVAATPVTGGMRFDIGGDGAVADSIRRMTRSHDAMTDGRDGRHASVADTPDGATMIVTGDNAAAAQKIRALGFFGLMSDGVHHQQHHMMMAKGEMHH